MNDFELFKAMNEAEEKYNRLRNEFRKRGLHKKAYCEFTRLEPAVPNVPGLAELEQAVREYQSGYRLP